MPSLRSRLFVGFLKHRHLLQGRWRRTTEVYEGTLIPSLRAEAERGAKAFGRLPKSVQLEKTTLGSLQAEWLLPRGATRPPEAALLYFHGGGLVLGSAASHRGIVAKFVVGSGEAALVPDYALAPERPFPAALDDAVAAYRHLLAEGIAAHKIVCMGDSGGGNLCLSLLLALREEGLPMPAGAVTLSAWTDLTNSGASWQDNAELDSLCWADAQTHFAAMYAAGQDPAQALISPLFGELEGLPPLLMFVGGHETMRDDTLRFAARAEAAGVEVTTRVGEGLFHCYPVCTPLFPEAKAAAAEICAFIRRRIRDPRTPSPTAPGASAR